MSVPAIISVLFFVAATFAPDSTSKIIVKSPDSKTFIWLRSSDHWTYDSETWKISPDKITISESDNQNDIVDLSAQSEIVAKHDWNKDNVLTMKPFGQFERITKGMVFHTNPESSKNSIFTIQYK